MGSGNRVKLYYDKKCFGLGFIVSDMPFAFTLNIQVLFWNLQVGLGKAYDEW